LQRAIESNLDRLSGRKSFVREPAGDYQLLRLRLGKSNKFYTDEKPCKGYESQQESSMLCASGRPDCPFKHCLLSYDELSAS
jgi:hypothetical protein